MDNSKKEVTYDLTLGAVGPTGPAGPPGGVDGYEIAIDETVVDDFPIKQLQVNCPAGKNAPAAEPAKPHVPPMPSPMWMQIPVTMS